MKGHATIASGHNESPRPPLVNDRALVAIADEVIE